MDVYNKIGEQIKKARQAAGVGQKVLASALGYTSATISQYENGKRCILLTDLEKIAGSLNQPLTYFIAPEKHAGETRKRGLYVSLKQYKAIQTVKRLQKELKEANAELIKQKKQTRKLENKTQTLLQRIAEQSQIASQLAGLYNELKRNETTLREAEKKSTAHSATQNIAYQLNNPLTALLGFIQILISEIPTSLCCNQLLNAKSASGGQKQNPKTELNVQNELKRLEFITKRCIKIIKKLLGSWGGGEEGEIFEKRER